MRIYARRPGAKTERQLRAPRIASLLSPPVLEGRSRAAATAEVFFCGSDLGGATRAVIFL